MKNNFWLLFLIFSVSVSGVAQKLEKDNQWWLGLKGGINSTILQVGDRYSVYTFSDANTSSKNYDLKYKKGFQLGILGAWDFWQGFNLSFQPQFATYKFSYESQNIWKSEGDELKVVDLHQQAISRLFFPLLLRYEFSLPKMGHAKQTHAHDKQSHVYHADNQHAKKKSKTIPYLQAGMQYSRLIAAQKTVTRAETVNSFEYEQKQELVDIKDLFNQKNAAFMFGGGVSYDVGGSFRVALDATYQLDMDNLVNQKNRYSNEKLNLTYQDAMDDFKLRNWAFSIHFLFPLKFVYSGNYKAL